MPKIPTQKARTVMPNVGGGGGGGSRSGGGGGGGAAMGSPNASRYANIEGTGLQSAGQQIASGAAGLSQAFQHAGQVRDQINAHLDSLNAKTGAFQLAMEGAARMKQNKEYVQEQLRAQGDKDPRTWTVQVRQPDGSFTEMSPDPAMQSMLRETMDEYLGYANVYGPEAVAQVAGSLSRDGQTEYSNYSDTHIKMKHDKTLGDYAVVRDRMVGQAADDTNPYRETVKLNLQDHIDNAVKHGAITPTEGVKQKADTKAEIADKYWSSFAIRHPDQMMRIATAYKTTPSEEDKGDESTISKDFGSAKYQKLPEDLDPTKLDHYMALANGRKASELAAVERLEKANAARTEANALLTKNDLITAASKADASLEIEKKRDELGKYYDDVVNYNHEMNNARRVDVTRATKDQSELTQYTLMHYASLAKYDPSLLEPTHPHAITHEVVMGHITGSKDLLPEHGAAVEAKINEAIAYQTQEDPAKRQAEQGGLKLLEKIFFAPQNLNPEGQQEMKRLESEAYGQLITEYEKNPTGNRNEMAFNVQAKYLPRVLVLQKASLQALDQELQAMEESWPKGFASVHHELNEGTRKKLETNNPAMRGLLKAYDAKAKEYRRLEGVGERTAEYAEKQAKVVE